MKSERLIKVDSLDNAISAISKLDAHSPPTLHRAFSVLLFKNSKLLLQKRSSHKLTWPNCWTNTCCSHPHWNEQGYSGILSAIDRKLNDELGINSAGFKFMFLGKILYKSIYNNEFGEYEMDYILACNVDDLEFSINEQEVSESMFVDREKLEWVLSNEQVTPWFRLICNDYIKNWWDELDKTGKITENDGIILSSV